MVTDCTWEVQRQGLKLTLGLSELAVGYRGAFPLDRLNLSYLQHDGVTCPEVVKDVEPVLKAEDQSHAQHEGCDCSGLTSRMVGARLSTEPWGRPESGRKKKRQWRYQRSYRIKSKTGVSYSSTRN